jgi:hypothetical protein
MALVAKTTPDDILTQLRVAALLRTPVELLCAADGTLAAPSRTFPRGVWTQLRVATLFWAAL